MPELCPGQFLDVTLVQGHRFGGVEQAWQNSYVIDFDLGGKLDVMARSQSLV